MKTRENVMRIAIATTDRALLALIAAETPVSAAAAEAMGHKPALVRPV
jgi:hypothetical protein